MDLCGPAVVGGPLDLCCPAAVGGPVDRWVLTCLVSAAGWPGTRPGGPARPGEGQDSLESSC